MTEKQKKLLRQIRLYGLAMARFFPIQLLLLHLKRSWLFLAFWVLLFGVAAGAFFKTLGIPFLFTTPEYLEEVNPLSYFIVGLVLGLFTMAFHISSYIFYSHKFPFLATLSRPLYRFSFNNSIIPVSFYLFYIVEIAMELSAEGLSWMWILLNIAGLLAGSVISISLSFSWFFSTIRPRVFEKIGETLDKTLRLVIVEEKSPERLDLEGRHKVVTYLKNFHSVRWARDTGHYTQNDLLIIIQKHHANAALFLILVTLVMLSLSWFVDQPFLMIPAAASILLFMTFYLMIVGALYSRFKGWTFVIFLAAGLIVNYISGMPGAQKIHYAFGLDYSKEPAEYSITRLQELTDTESRSRDQATTIRALNAWKERTGEDRPKLIIVNSSGGGLRSSLWSLAMLSRLDNETEGHFWKNAFLITGSSGGMVGTAYFREIQRREQTTSLISPTDEVSAASVSAYENMGKDILNPVGFTLVSTDLFWSFKKFTDAGSSYPYDRGWSFEQQLNDNTGMVFPARWREYADAEQNGRIPWMILSPTIINEGRRLLISNLGVSYLARNDNPWTSTPSIEIDGVDFYRFFEEQRGDSLRLTTALRMSATFPYITPLVSMPSDPRMEVIDAGARDNNGFELSLRFVYEFRNWIRENTSGVVFVQLMANDPPSDEISGSPYRTRFDGLIKPIGGVVNSFTYLQPFSATEHLHFAGSWIDFPADIVPFQLLDSKEQEISLSWHLTEREKRFIRDNALSERIGERTDELNRILDLPLSNDR